MYYPLKLASFFVFSFAIVILFSLLFENSLNLSFEKLSNKNDFSGMNIIPICCAWGSEIKDGILTYSIKDGNKTLDNAVIEAASLWNSHLNGLQFEKSKGNTDIKISFTADGKAVAGKTTNLVDNQGFIRKSNILLAKESFDKAYSILQLEKNAEHELGHVLGLEHANFNGNLMSTNTASITSNISPCVIEAVDTANAWKLKEDDGDSIHGPTQNHVVC
jgi:hypothetical protein